MGDFRRGAIIEDAVCTEIDVRKLQTNHDIAMCRYSLNLCKKNVISSNSTQKLLVQKKELCDVSLQVGRSNLLCVERSSL